MCVGYDYSPNGTISGEIPASNTSRCQILTALSDSEVEEDEYLLVSLSLKKFEPIEFLPEVTRPFLIVIIVDQTIPPNQTSLLSPTPLPTLVLIGKMYIVIVVLFHNHSNHNFSCQGNN